VTRMTLPRRKLGQVVATVDHSLVRRRARREPETDFLEARPGRAPGAGAAGGDSGIPVNGTVGRLASSRATAGGIATPTRGVPVTSEISWARPGPAALSTARTRGVSPAGVVGNSTAVTLGLLA